MKRGCLRHKRHNLPQRGHIFGVAGITGASVYFDDGRLFHDFTLRMDHSEAEHLCGDDLYRVGYHIKSPDVWRATWTVTGPRKDYTMCSLYHRERMEQPLAKPD